MNTLRLLLSGCLLAISFFAHADVVGTTFTYQGELQQLGAPANGAFDFQFNLYDVSTDGDPITNAIQVDDSIVAVGVFTVELDFGSAAFDGNQLWLEIAVRDGLSDGDFSTLTPRQLITAAPFAVRALEGTIEQIVCSDGEIIIYNGSTAEWNCGDLVASVPDGSITVQQIDTTSVQSRVTGTCSVGSVVRAINADGSVVCEPDVDTTLSEGEVDVFVANNGYSTGEHTVDTDMSCSLSNCIAPGRATLTCDTTSVTLNCVPPPSYDTCSAPDALVEGVTEGAFSTVGAADDYDLSCLTFDSRDTTHEIDLAGAAALLVTLTPQAPDWNLAAALREDCAAGPDLSCVASHYTPRYINQPNLAAGIYELIVDGDSGAAGDYTVQYDTRAADTSYGYWVQGWTDTFAPLTGATMIPIDTGIPDGDGWGKAVALPFDFDYFGTVYAEASLLTVTDDMYISFNPYVGGSESYLNECLDNTEPHDMIAPFWDDGIAYSATAQLLYKVEGDAPNRTLTIEWRNWDILGPSPNYYIITVLVSHQVVLFENGDIEFRYGPRSDPAPDNVGCQAQHLGCSATIGIEAGTSSAHDADVVDCEFENTTEGRVIHFVHPT